MNANRHKLYSIHILALKVGSDSDKCFHSAAEGARPALAVRNGAVHIGAVLYVSDTEKHLPIKYNWHSTLDLISLSKFPITTFLHNNSRVRQMSKSNKEFNFLEFNSLHM